MNLSPNSLDILARRYQRRDEDGNLVETPEGIFRRVSRAVALGESNDRVDAWEQRFYDLMKPDDQDGQIKFLPNSPTLVNAGTGRGCLSACFVVSPEDNLESIMKVGSDAAMIEKWGGGIGFGLSKLRPANDRIKTTHGNACGPIAVMKLYSAIGGTLTQGAFRLGAHMGQLSMSHPDIREFIHCKDNDDTLENFNVSVQVTDEFMEAVKSDGMWNLVNPRDEGDGPADVVVETVRARELWDELVESAWKTGDPGIAFMDRVWESAPNPQMGPIQTSNPCVTGDTLVYTGDGLTPIRDLVGQTPTLALDSRSGKTFSIATKVWSSGVKPVYRLVTKEGYSIKLTAEHQVFTTKGKVAAGDLKPGDRIRLLDHKGKFGSLGTPMAGMILGHLAGGGSIDPISAGPSFSGEELEEFGTMRSEDRQAVVAGTEACPAGTRPMESHIAPVGRGMVTSTPLKHVGREHRLRGGGWRNGGDVVLQGTEGTQRAYLQALFDEGGTISGGSSEWDVGVRLNSSYPGLLADVQRMVLNFGIASRMYLRSDEPIDSLPAGEGGQQDYKTLPTCELVISGDNVERFAEEIGFLTGHKNAFLAERMGTCKRGLRSERFLSTFERLEPLGEEEVYDLTEPMTHSFIANGFTISNCGEEWLEDYGNCCLGSINLAAHVADGGFDWDELRKTVRTSVRFLDDVININEFPLPRLREVNLDTRRIGLGVMGWADALVSMGIPYDSDEAVDLADEVGDFIASTAWKMSEELAAERGAYPEYENSRLKEHGMPPVRHSSIMTIAPTGTISRLAGVSSGIEPHFGVAWWSNVLWDAQGGRERLLDSPASVRAAVGEEGLMKVADNPGNKDSILSEYGLDPAIFRTAMEITPEAHVRMQAAWQAHATNAVSKTINLPNSATVQDVSDAYMLAYETGCKSITVYRDGSKSEQVLEVATTRPVETPPVPVVEAPPAAPKPRPRPVSVLGRTDRIRTGHGNMYVNITFDDQGNPFEVFSTVGKAGGCDSANLEAVSRLASLALRSGVHPINVVGQLQGIRCCPAWDNHKLVQSAPDAMAHVLGAYVGEGDSTDVEVMPVSHAEAVQESLFSPIAGGSDAYSGLPMGYGSFCPKCGGGMVMQEGCMNCVEPTCGYSKCG